MAFAQTRAQIDQYVKDKTWYWYVPLWLFGLFGFVSLLGFDLTKPLPFVVMVPHAFDFMLHEFAHVFTAWLPPLVTAAAGSFSELLLGGLLVYGAFQFRNYFASLFCLLWLMLACMSVGSYMADALPQRIPLVSLGGAMTGSESVVHDWHFVFGQLGLLGSSSLIGNSVRVFGILAGAFGLIFAAWLIRKMAASPDKKPMTKEDLEMLKAAAAGDKPKAQIYPKPIKGNLADDDKAPTNSNPKQG